MLKRIVLLALLLNLLMIYTLHAGVLFDLKVTRANYEVDKITGGSTKLLSYKGKKGFYFGAGVDYYTMENEETMSEIFDYSHGNFNSELQLSKSKYDLMPFFLYMDFIMPLRIGDNKEKILFNLSGGIGYEFLKYSYWDYSQYFDDNGEPLVDPGDMNNPVKEEKSLDGLGVKYSASVAIDVFDEKWFLLIEGFQQEAEPSRDLEGPYRLSKKMNINGIYVGLRYNNY